MRYTRNSVSPNEPTLPLPKLAWKVLLPILAVVTGLHVACLQQYGYFRDELYYLACAARLDWGYVDHPPLSILVLKGITGVLGSDLWAVRLGAVACGLALIVVAAMTARLLGGDWMAQGLAALAVAAAPVYRVVGHLYSMNSIDVLLWAILVYMLVRVWVQGENRMWLWIGPVLGMALMNKFSVLWLIAGVFVGLVATGHRRSLLGWGPWVALLAASLIFAPHLVWQAQNHWIGLEFVRNAAFQKMVPVGPVQFFATQIVVMNPAVVPIVTVGVWAAWRRPELRPMALAFLTVIGILLLSGRSRENYLSPAYAFVIAPGAVAMEGWLRGRPPFWSRSYGLVLAASGLSLASLALPLWPIDRLSTAVQKTIAKTGVEIPKAEKGPSSPLQGFADMEGWPELAETVSKVYHELPEADRRRAVIFGQNYGESAAIDHFGPALGLPRAIGRHNNYWLWGPGPYDGGVLIYINTVPDRFKGWFDSVEQRARVDAPFAVPEQQDAPISVLRGLKMPVADFWRRIKHIQ